MKNFLVILFVLIVGFGFGVAITMYNLKPVDIIQSNGEGKTTIGIELCGQIWDYELNEIGVQSVNE